MSKYKIFFIFILFIFNFIYAKSLENEAYNALKNHNFVKYISIYKKLSKKDNYKAILILGTLYESGLGVKKDLNKAKKLYNYILKKTINLKYVKNNNQYKLISYAIIASKRLYKISKDKKYLSIINKLQKLKKNINLLNSELFNKNNQNNDYFILCPSAKIINQKYQEGIEEFDCSLFEKYPYQMQEFMKLRYKRFQAIDNNRVDKLKDIDKKIYYSIKPIIKDLQENLIKCYINATKVKDLYNCNYDYYSKSDALLFQNNAFKLQKYLLTHKINDSKLSPNKKEDIIIKLITLIEENKLIKDIK